MILQHGSCAAWKKRGVLLIGKPGSGKSDLLLRLTAKQEWLLVADDQVCLRAVGSALSAEAPPSLSGLIEIRGMGVLEGIEVASSVMLSLVVDCVNRDDVPRLPVAREWSRFGIGLPMLALHALDASAPHKVEVALLAAIGSLKCRVGAFTPMSAA